MKMIEADKTVSMKKIAKIAGVSLATVSRALNEPGKLKPATRERVLRTIRELDYYPNRLAQGLRSRKSKIIGLILQNVINPFYAELMQVVQQEANQYGYSIILCESEDNNQRQLHYLQLLQEWNAEGVILAGAIGTEPVAQGWRGISERVVQVSRYFPEVGHRAVISDNFEGARRATKHLISLGYRRIALIGGAAAINTARDRIRGYLEALSEAGLEFRSDLVVLGEFSEESGYNLTRQLMELKEPPEAIFSASNLNTYGSLFALKDLGKSIPRDVAFVSFDDIKTGAILNPPLTAVTQDVKMIGQEAVGVIINRNGKVNRDVVIVVPTDFVVRESCGCLLRGGSPQR